MNNLSDNAINKVVDNTNGVSKEGGDLMSLSFFNSDPYFKFVYKKSERLCLAIYLMTDFFPAEDPIKDSLRKSGTALVKVSLSFITASSPFRKEILNDISRLCLEIISLSKVSSNIGMTSMPNHNVLEAEIKNFISVIEEREKPNTTGQGFVLNESGSVFGNDTKDHVQQLPQDPKDVFKVEEGVEKKTVADFNNRDNRKIAQNIKVESIVKSELPEKPTKNTTNTINIVGKSVMQKNDRQHLILEIIKEIGESSIKDISDNIKDCSEKTIQRELNTLIYNGALKKIGERRWSKYVLA